MEGNYIAINVKDMRNLEIEFKKKQTKWWKML